jgi:hypothetical protein
MLMKKGEKMIYYLRYSLPFSIFLSLYFFLIIAGVGQRLSVVPLLTLLLGEKK